MWYRKAIAKSNWLVYNALESLRALQEPRFRLVTIRERTGVELRINRLVRNAMSLPVRANRRTPVCTSRGCPHQQPPTQRGKEQGQSMLEMTVGMVFLVIIVLILFEMAVLFYSYIALLNASREGAVYAATHPALALMEDPGDPDDPEYSNYLTYETITTAEAVAGGLRTDPEFFDIKQPEVLEGEVDPLDPIIVRVSYQLINPTQGIILPFLGRMGLFQSAWMTASTEMPIQ